MIKHVVSVSGGKDSAATLAIAINRVGKENLKAISCDTGNEHQAVYDYLDYLERFFDITIYRLKADFSEHIARKRVFIARDQRTRREYDTVPMFEADGKTPVPKRNGCGQIITKQVKRDGMMVDEPVQKTRKVGGGKKIRWSNKSKRRGLSVLRPTGNPFLDLCLWKGRFPSRKAQFCTQELKTAMAVSYQIDLMDQGYLVVSWQGVRRDESLNRRNAKKIERIGNRLWTFRPIVDWTAHDVFSYCESQGLQANPLYKQGMGRVGCMPCINVNKDELKNIAARFPAHIVRISAWEHLVAQASKREASTFIPAPGITPDQAKDNGIYSVIEWARTTRGGRQFSLLESLEDNTACSSAYGLCE